MQEGTYFTFATSKARGKQLGVELCGRVTIITAIINVDQRIVQSHGCSVVCFHPPFGFCVSGLWPGNRVREVLLLCGCGALASPPFR